MKKFDKKNQQKPVKKMTKVEKAPVDVQNNAMMIAEGIRLPDLKPRDPAVWTKTPEEKRLLKIAKRRDNSKFLSQWSAHPKNGFSYQAKLIFHIKPNDVFTKTTYSFDCRIHEIQAILKKFKNCIFGTYSWNGKEYDRTELPVWK